MAVKWFAVVIVLVSPLNSTSEMERYFRVLWSSEGLLIIKLEISLRGKVREMLNSLWVVFCDSCFLKLASSNMWHRVLSRIFSSEIHIKPVHGTVFSGSAVIESRCCIRGTTCRWNGLGVDCCSSLHCSDRHLADRSHHRLHPVIDHSHLVFYCGSCVLLLSYC